MRELTRLPKKWRKSGISILINLDLLYKQKYYISAKLTAIKYSCNFLEHMILTQLDNTHMTLVILCAFNSHIIQ